MHGSTRRRDTPAGHRLEVHASARRRRPTRRHPAQRRQARALLLPPRRRRGAAGGDHAGRRRGAPARRVVGGAYERPKIVEDLEIALGELQIEWIPVPDDSPWIGRTLAECGFRAKTGITVIAILREPEPVTGAQPGDTIERCDTLVTVGKAGQYSEFRRLLSRGDSVTD